MSENVAFPSSDCLGLQFDEQELFAYDEEPSAYLLSWTGRVIHWEENDETTAVKRPIGNFRAIFVNAVGAINDGVSLFDVFDTEQTTFDYYQALFDGDTDEFTQQVLKVAFRGDYPLTPNLLILDRLAILPEYRGKGRGLLVLRGLMQYLGPGAGLMAMKPFPLRGEGRPRSPEALNRPSASNVAPFPRFRPFSALMLNFSAGVSLNSCSPNRAAPSCWLASLGHFHALPRNMPKPWPPNSGPSTATRGCCRTEASPCWST